VRQRVALHASSAHRWFASRKQKAIAARLLRPNVPIPSKIAAAAEPHQRYSKRKKENLMTSRNLKRFAASRVTAALVLAGMLVLGSGTARAQSERGLQGTWRALVTVRNCQTGVALRTFPAMFTFAKGGTLIGTTAGQLPSLSTPNLGVWHHIDGQTYSAVSETFIFSPAGAWTQTHRLTRVIEVGSNGDEFTDTIALEIFDTMGNVIATGCGTTVASRFE
jgi:hypothetical protein